MFEQLQRLGCDVGRSKNGRLLRVDNRPCSESLPIALLQQMLSCEALKELYLRNVDEFLLANSAELAGLTKLKVLDVEGSNLDNDSIRHFQDCPALQVLNVRGTQVAESVVTELRKAMINTRIIF